MTDSQPRGFEFISLGITCPMANEKDSALSFVQDVLKTCSDYGFKEQRFYATLDRVCTDGTLEILKEAQADLPDLEVVWAPENRCVVDAYLRGYKSALANRHDWILEIDAGYSHRPEDIPKFFDKMAEGYECVFASRYRQGGRMTNIHPVNYVISRFGTFLANALLGTRLSDMTSGFELFSAKALNDILAQGLISKTSFFQTELKAHAHRFRIAEVGILYKPTPSRVRAAEITESLKSLLALKTKLSQSNKGE